MFTTDLPDDQVEDERDIIRFGGRNVAEAIAGILRELGCDVGEPRDAGEHGWDVVARKGGRRFCCEVTSFHPHILLYFEDDPPVQAPDGHRGLAEAFNEALRRDGRFHNLLWYFDGFVPGVDSGGSGTESPLAADPGKLAAAGSRKPMVTGRNLLIAAGWLLLCVAYYAAKRYLPGW